MLLKTQPEFDSQSFLSNYEEEKRWIRSQLTPLNYLFEKLKSIEEKFDNLQVKITTYRRNKVECYVEYTASLLLGYR